MCRGTETRDHGAQVTTVCPECLQSEQESTGARIQRLGLTPGKVGPWTRFGRKQRREEEKQERKNRDYILGVVAESGETEK